MKSIIGWSIPLIDLDESRELFKIISEKNINYKIDFEEIKELFGKRWGFKKSDDVIKFFKKINIISNKGEIIDKDISVPSEKILEHIVKKMYINLIAFRLLIDILKEYKTIHRSELKNKLTQNLLEYVKKHKLAEYRKKIKKLQKTYKEINVWQYPEPSFNRFLRFAKSVELIKIEGGSVKLKEEKLSILLEKPKEVTLKLFEEEFYKTYDKLYENTNIVIQSIDETRNIICTNLGISSSLFDKFMVELLDRHDKKIQTFQSRNDKEIGLRWREKIIFKYRIIK